MNRCTPWGEFFRRDLAVIDLFSDCAVPHDWTRDQLRKERYVQRQREGVALHAGRTAVDIHYVGQRLERKNEMPIGNAMLGSCRSMCSALPTICPKKFRYLNTNKMPRLHVSAASSQSLRQRFDP